MDNEGHDDLIDEVADALTLRQDVDWDRCARLVTPSNRGCSSLSCSRVGVLACWSLEPSLRTSEPG